MYLLIQNEGEAPITSYTLLGDSGSRGRQGTIGQFGSGNKHAINLLLRAGIEFYIYSGPNRLEFYVERRPVTEADGTQRIQHQVMCRVTGKITIYNQDIYDPELDVVTRLAVFQRLSGATRTRGNLDVDFRWELIQDFFWGFSIYYSFDNSPENPDASTNDYGVVTSLDIEPGKGLEVSGADSCLLKL